ncbi:MAG: sulfatase [Paenibacillaceae bacterium]|nr:sulfatase [Paenibacillaceae bacterium]
MLRESGYDTGYAGKWHLDGEPSHATVPPDRAMGFDDCRYMLNGHFKEVRETADGSVTTTSSIGDETTYMTDWLADKTVDFLRTPHDNPFLFMVSFPDPHQPFKVRPPYDTMFDPQKMPIPATFYDEQLPDWADQDEWGRKRYFPLHMANREQKLRAIKAQYCGEVKCIDDNVGKILRCLRDQGLADNTLVVFLTDHGEYMGEHGLLEKNNLYETAYRIPLLMRWPGRLTAGTTVKKIATMVDVLPTVLGLLGIQSSGREQGRDASPLLTGQKTEWADEAFIHPNDVPRTGVFTPEFELAYVGRGWRSESGHQFKDHILFDRVRDPEQRHNLFNDPAYGRQVSDLTQRIVAHHKQLGTDPALLPEALHRFWDGPDS